MGTYITIDDLEDRVSAKVLVEILDDDVDGTVDTTVLARVIADAESTVESYLRKVYDLAVLRARGVNAPNEVKRLCLEIAVAYLWDRFPEYVRADGRQLRLDTLDELRDLARGIRRLDDISTIENTAQVTVEARSGDPDNPDPALKMFNYPGAFGDY